MMSLPKHYYMYLDAWIFNLLIPKVIKIVSIDRDLNADSQIFNFICLTDCLYTYYTLQVLKRTFKLLKIECKGIEKI